MKTNIKSIRLKYLTKEPLQYGLNIEAKHYSDYGIRFLRTTDINDSGEIREDGIYLKEDIVPENYLLKKGDILFSRSGTIGRCYFHQSNESMTYAGFLVRFRLKDLELAKWIYYYSKTPEFNTILHSQAIESTIKNFNGQKFNNIAIPSNHLQLTINNYLDIQTKKIKAFITKKNTFIKLLKEQRQSVIDNAVTKGLDKTVKLKNTGIDWLGDIPEHWEVKRIKNVSSLISKGTTPSTVGSDTIENGTIRFLKAENLYKNKVSQKPVFYIDEKTDNILFRSRLKENDVLLVIAGATIGRLGLLTKEFTPANTNQAVCFIRPENIIPEYLLLWMKCSYMNNLIWFNANQSAQPNLAMSHIAKFRVLLPPSKEEQAQIITHIKTETAKIDQAIAKAEKEIGLIQEYQKAMIAEAVLGKIKL